jgi:hypothetical protein
MTASILTTVAALKQILCSEDHKAFDGVVELVGFEPAAFAKSAHVGHGTNFMFWIIACKLKGK